MREPRYRSSGVYQEPLWGKDVSQKNQVIWCWIEGNCVQIMPALGSQIGTGRHTLGYFISPAAVIPTLRGTKWGVWRCCRHWFPSSKQILELKSIYILATLIRESVNSARFTTYSSWAILQGLLIGLVCRWDLTSAGSLSINNPWKKNTSFSSSESSMSILSINSEGCWSERRRRLCRAW